MIRENALKEYESQHTQALYNITLYGYYRNLSGDHKNECDHYFNLYLIHNQAAQAIKRILSIRDNKITLKKIDINCAFNSQKMYAEFLQKGSEKQCINKLIY